MKNKGLRTGLMDNINNRYACQIQKGVFVNKEMILLLCFEFLEQAKCVIYIQGFIFHLKDFGRVGRNHAQRGPNQPTYESR